MITIRYPNGCININEEEFFPTDAHRMNVLCDTLQLSYSYNLDEALEMIREHFEEKIAGIKKALDVLNPNVSREKKEIKGLTLEMNRYLNNAERIVKDFSGYGFERLTEGREKVTMKKSKVYALTSKGIEEHDGYIFTVSGYGFKSYKNGKGYSIVFAGTGLTVGYSEKLNDGPAEVQKLIHAIQGIDADGSLATTRKIFIDKMIAAGYMQPEAIQEETAADPEPEAIPEEIPQPEQPQEEPEAEPQQAADPEPQPQPEKKPVPEKTFAGSVLSGKKYRISFDSSKARTIVTLAADASDAEKDAVKAAGFWPTSTGTYSKKLTWKAYRAALQLQQELDKLAG